MQRITWLAMLVVVNAAGTRAWSQPQSNDAGAAEPPPIVALLVRANGEYVVDIRPETKDEFLATLNRIKRAGQSLAIRAEGGVAKDQLCSLLANCRQRGIEPIEFAECTARCYQR